MGATYFLKAGEVSANFISFIVVPSVRSHNGVLCAMMIY
jgi:hypothetical protein